MALESLRKQKRVNILARYTIEKTSIDNAWTLLKELKSPRNTTRLQNWVELSAFS